LATELFRGGWRITTDSDTFETTVSIARASETAISADGTLGNAKGASGATVSAEDTLGSVELGLDVRILAAVCKYDRDWGNEFFGARLGICADRSGKDADESGDCNG
jgi:hypothetical protein